MSIFVSLFAYVMLFIELPGLLAISEVAEALMYVPNGPWLLCRLVANSPDSFKQGIVNLDDN